MFKHLNVVGFYLTSQFENFLNVYYYKHMIYLSKPGSQIKLDSNLTMADLYWLSEYIILFKCHYFNVMEIIRITNGTPNKNRFSS